MGNNIDELNNSSALSTKINEVSWKFMKIRSISYFMKITSASVPCVEFISYLVDIFVVCCFGETQQQNEKGE